jgi:hypothetical protein
MRVGAHSSNRTVSERNFTEATSKRGSFSGEMSIGGGGVGIRADAGAPGAGGGGGGG